ncbi:MAG: insulinase family protein [Tannerellaceae bacterium]|nr:insulinase family protein [Tannerellaceae bacterium]
MMDSDLFTYTFSNGLRLIHMFSDSPVSYCGLAVNAGARDEEASEYGLAHFVEHMLFKGTGRRKAHHILNRMENVGGELNAYTSKEETFVYSIFMEEHFGRALELLCDIVFDSRFPRQEIEKEVDVILDEINTYRDSPSELIFDEFENMLFARHALGHNILGDEGSLPGFGTDSGLSFMERFYAPSNIVFFSMGRIRPDKIVRMAGKVMPEGRPGAVHKRMPPGAIALQSERLRRDTHQTHVIMGGRSYGMYEGDERRIPLFVLNNILGGPGMNSRLNMSLRERHGLAYTVESSLTSYTDTGLAAVYFGTDPKNTDKAMALVGKELDAICRKRLSGSQLAAAKKQITGQLCVSGDNKESLFLGMGKQFLHHNRYRRLPSLLEKIDGVTAEDILEAANEVFAPHLLSSLIYEQ